MSENNKTDDTVEGLKLQIKKLNRLISLQEKRITRAEAVVSTRSKVTEMLKAERLAQDTYIKHANTELANKTELIDALREQIRLREETETALYKAQEANQTKTNFLANMSHEIRTPLNAVIGLSDLILGTDSIDEESRYRLEQIYNAGETLLSTVNDILDISKIEAGKFELIPVVYELASMINDTVTQSLLHGREKPIKFNMNICNHLPTHLLGDELRIKQVLNNLLSNAFKYTLEGTVELSIDCKRDEDEVMLIVTIKDTGIGIRSESMDSLFTDYSQMDMAANRKIEGTGLGLSITKRLTVLMNGSITVDSVFGKGSRFTVRIPQKSVTENVIGEEVIKSLKTFHYSEHKRRRDGSFTRITLPYARVLIVDDVVTNLDVAKGLMKPYHMQIDCVSGGFEAIEAMHDERVRYNAIFMDHMMPGMDGIEATRRIREIGNDYAGNIPIIALTANAIVGNEEMFLKNGFQSFISKPIEVMHLDNVIREWIRDKNQENLLAGTSGPSEHGSTEGKNLQALYKGVDGLNVRQGLKRFSGDNDAYFDVLRSFSKNTLPLLEVLKEVNENNLSDYTTTVHGIKGSSRSICADDIADMAEALENAAMTGNIRYIEAHNQGMIETTKKFITDITGMITEIENDNQKPKKDKPDKETLDRLSKACVNYEMNEVDAALEELEAYDYETGGYLVTWLRENVEKMNFDAIVEELSVLC